MNFQITTAEAAASQNCAHAAIRQRQPRVASAKLDTPALEALPARREQGGEPERKQTLNDYFLGVPDGI